MQCDQAKPRPSSMSRANSIPCQVSGAGATPGHVLLGVYLILALDGRPGAVTGFIMRRLLETAAEQLVLVMVRSLQNHRVVPGPKDQLPQLLVVAGEETADLFASHQRVRRRRPRLAGRSLLRRLIEGRGVRLAIEHQGLG